MRIQSHSLPLHEEEGEVAGDGVGGAGEEVSYHIIFHKQKMCWSLAWGLKPLYFSVAVLKTYSTA